MKADEYDFYKLTLPEEMHKNEQLVFELDPNSILDTINNIVSDPNLYISVSEKMPTYSKSTWRSNRFGNEIITIGGAYINPFQNFYIGVHCKEKCNYILKITMVDSIILKDNQINSYTLEEKTVMKFCFTTKDIFNELSVYIFGSYLNSFNAYLYKNEETYMSILEAEPFLFNGYKFIINNAYLNNKNARYDLVVDNNNEKQELNIWLKYNDEYTRVKEAEIIYDAITEKKANCYYYTIDKINQNKDIVISTTLFNGLGFLYISGFSPISPGNINLGYKNKDNSYSIVQNKALYLTKDNFSKFGKYNNDGNTQLNFCFYAEKNSSLSIKAHLFENFKTIQTLNYIYPGIKLEDILPKKSLTRYKMEHFNIKNDLYIFLKKKSGNSKLYLYMIEPEKNNDLLDYDNFQPLKRSDFVLEAQEYFNSYYLYLTKELNKCKINRITNQYNCYLNAIVECSQEEDCTYEIFFDHSRMTKAMELNEIYTNVISENETDTYLISTNDPSVKNIAVVLTPIAGKVSLKLDSFRNEHGVYNGKFEVQNDDFMPGLFKLSHKMFNLDNLIGHITLKVEGLSYASYSIYYYVFREEENEEYLDHEKISMKLETGKVIKDIFMDNHRFKVYMYDCSNNGEGNKSNLFITLIETDWVDSELYIFTDLNDFSILDDRIYGYTWRADYKDYIYIDKTDINYIQNDILYIMVFKNAKNYKNEYTTFYLGITDENTPFLLNEGIEFKHQFDSNHESQTFFYYFMDNEDDLKISFSLYWGHLIVKVKIQNILYTMLNIIDDSYLITIPRTKINEMCKKSSKCPIYIEVSNDKEYYYYSSFLLAVRSTKNIPLQLNQGMVNKRKILSGEEHYFIIDLKPDKSFGGKISVYFEKGEGIIFARKLLKSELNNITNFPNEQNYEYMASYQTSNRDFYVIEIPYEDISNYEKCKILLTVRGVFPGYFYTTTIEYSISISNNLYELVTDKNYKLFISQGEISHFHFKVGKNKKRLYISMTNKLKDANMYLNYETYCPTLSEYNWENIGGFNEYFDISLDDPYFAQRQMEDIDGDYYLAIQGLDDCFYNLYISTQDVKIMTLTRSSPAGCSCESKNDYCYFRYENINEPAIREVEDQHLIFYTEFTYGSGSIFGKLYPSGNMEEIMNSLPTSSNYEFLGYTSEELILPIDLTKQNLKYTFSSVLVVGVQCKAKSLFDLSVAQLDRWSDLSRNNNNFIFLNSNQDNIFYISPDTGKTNKFIYYLYDEELNLQIKGLIGKAKVHIYLNDTLINYKFDESENKKISKNNYHHISEFDIDSNKEGNKIYYGNIPKQYGKYNYIFIDVKPLETCLININVHFDINMTYIPLNKEVIGYIKVFNFYAYFDLMKDTDEYMVTVTSMEKSKNFKVFIKKNIIKIGEDTNINNQTIYSKANWQNYDIKGSTNPLTSSVSLKIKNIEKSLRQNSLVRVLINVDSDSYCYNEKIKIIVTPIINNINRIHPQQHEYYFSSMENKYIDKTLFMLRNINKEDDLMIIEISSCKGNFIYNLVDSPPSDTETYTQLQKRRVSSIINVSNGKSIIIVPNLEVKEYYLIVYGANEKLDLFIDEKGENGKGKKNGNSEILFYYYTTNRKNYNYLVTNDTLYYEGIDDYYNIKIKLPALKKRDAFGRENYIDYMNYTFIVSENKYDFAYMSSTCYLTKLSQNKEKYEKYNYIKTNYDKENNIFDVKGFKGGKTYYANILAKNEYTGEIITYKPFMFQTSIFYRRAKVFVIIFLTIIFFVFLCLTFTIYRKYRIAKSKMNNLEMGKTSKNSSYLSKKLGNLKNINLNVIKKKYNSLSEDNQSLNDI